MWSDYLPLSVVLTNTHLQFQYNPEWFEDEDETGGKIIPACRKAVQSNELLGDDWDLEKYRAKREEERAEEETRRLAGLGLYEGEEGGSGGARQDVPA